MPTGRENFRIEYPSPNPGPSVAPFQHAQDAHPRSTPIPQGQGCRFVRDVLHDPDRAKEIEEESLDDYAERRKIALINIRKDK